MNNVFGAHKLALFVAQMPPHATARCKNVQLGDSCVDCGPMLRR
jgi:hypothetical protein